MDQAHAADVGGRFVQAGNLYWQAFESGDAFDVATTLRALFIFFDSTDPGVGPGHGLSNDEVEVARQRFHRMLDHLNAIGHAEDAEVWRWWIGQLGMDSEHPLPSDALTNFAQHGSREAAWHLAANGDRSQPVVSLVSSLQSDLADETSFRSAYILHMLKEFQVH
ncbi:hypothetical protein [Brevundimonas sp. NIBR11]|uniref:hypothetical protein n=1 Tax=Brevundimonas sp. NIBR11 TaxID=3015999 RepID=UPI0022F01DE2|nr:hypothetical protein [Brevundimonas sp. NIBR11]WGM31652.1 hypothetical protein KKHFBJBL_01899 [Brevundimonas sp. NIBR11]